MRLDMFHSRSIRSMERAMTYYLKALVLVARGGRYSKRGLAETLTLVARRECRLHWLRTSIELRRA
jgi:hypothetical protein